MKVCVAGLWHLGSVTAACLASLGHRVVGLDLNEEVITNLRQGKPPLFEPGLAELIAKDIESGSLTFSANPAEAVREASVIWVTYDTPVDEDDNADVDFVLSQVKKIISYAEPHTLVLISSQLPVGSARKLEAFCQEAGKAISFAYSPENLRLGKAIDIFTHPDRIVVGYRTESDKQTLFELLSPITDRIEWMSVESAEMVKHALNAFLATSVVFINEIASLCEKVGADAKEVERGLKSEARIGPKAYLGPGGPFAGGTLARDINFLINLGAQNDVPVHVFKAVKASNEAHKSWTRHRLFQLLGDLKGKVVTVWGLTYKPGTDTLRRSSSVELCQWLIANGATVKAYDPSIKQLPESLAKINLCESAEAALHGSSALVVATEWPDFRTIDPTLIKLSMVSPLVIDANGFLSKTMTNGTGITYVTVGRKVEA